MAEGTAVISASGGITRLILIGRGVMRFSPAPEAEKSQMRLLAGRDILETPFDVAVAQSPNMTRHADLARMAAAPVDDALRARAQAALTDASAGATTLGPDDFVADVKTSRFGALTYLRSEAASEDISLFNRTTQDVLSVYSSASQLAANGPFRSDDARAEYDVLHHDLDLTFTPEKRFIEGSARLQLRVRAPSVRQLPIRLAESLTIRDVSSPEAGRLSAVRVPGRDVVFVTFDPPLAEGAVATVAVSYSGNIQPPAAEWELPDATDRRSPAMAVPTYLTSTFPMWYPRPPYIDYATASLRLTLPAAFDCVASGELAAGYPLARGTGPAATKTFLFKAEQPIRHVAFLATPLVTVSERQLDPASPREGTSALPVSPRPLGFTVLAQPKAADAAAFGDTVADIARFYQSILGEFAYPHLTVALIDGQIPGGHTVAYSSAVGRAPSSVAPFWRSDPSAFDRFPDFVTAHEIAHQWWGQAIGWGTYHDQWMSEAFAQYFAVLYAEHRGGEKSLGPILNHMRMWSMDESRKGPLSLGPRLGQVQHDDSVFRALLYNKGPAVLHMLRRFVGDDAFFDGVRAFYFRWRFGKPATSDLREAMEAAAGRSLAPFFSQWIDGTAIPELRFSSRAEPSNDGSTELTLRIEQRNGPFQVPVSITIHYSDRPDARIVVPVVDRASETVVQVEGRFRSAEIDRSDGVLADFR